LQAASAAGAAAFIVLSWEGFVVMGGAEQSSSTGEVPIPGMLLAGHQALLLLMEMHAALLQAAPPPEATLALDPHTQGGCSAFYSVFQLHNSFCVCIVFFARH
jgi:hypothetical protein